MGTDCKSAAFQLRWFESTRAHEKTAGVEIHWRFSFAQMSDSHRRVDENSGGADCNDDERRQRRKQRGVVGAAASDTQARRSGCWVPQPVRLRRKQGGEAGAALRFFKARQGIAEKSASATRKARRFTSRRAKTAAARKAPCGGCSHFVESSGKITSRTRQCTRSRTLPAAS